MAIVVISNKNLDGLKAELTNALDKAFEKMGEKAKNISWFTGNQQDKRNRSIN